MMTELYYGKWKDVNLCGRCGEETENNWFVDCVCNSCGFKECCVFVAKTKVSTMYSYRAPFWKFWKSVKFGIQYSGNINKTCYNENMFFGISEDRAIKIGFDSPVVIHKDLGIYASISVPPVIRKDDG